MDTPAGRYNPLYYAAVGWPLVISPDLSGVLAARLVSAALIAGLFGWATVVAVSLRRRGALAGLVVALTPMTAHIAGAINPNGIEIAAGAGLVMALVAILFEPATAGSRSHVWWLAGVSGAVMLTVRSAGPLWFGVILAVMLVPLSLARYRALARARRAWWLAGAWTLFGLAGVGWSLWKRTYEIIPASRPDSPLTFTDALKFEIVREFGQTTAELVGVLGWLDTHLPMEIHLAWWLSCGVLFGMALAFGRPSDRWRVGGLAILGFAVPMATEALNVNKYGFGLQGRYVLPMLVGVPILAGYVLSERISLDLAPRLTRFLAGILLPAGIAALCWSMIRYQRGIPGATPPSFNPFGGSWQPAVGSTVPILMAVSSAVIFVLYYRRVTAGLTGHGMADEADVPGTSSALPVRDLVGARAASPSGASEHRHQTPAAPRL